MNIEPEQTRRTMSDMIVFFHRLNIKHMVNVIRWNASIKGKNIPKKENQTDVRGDTLSEKEESRSSRQAAKEIRFNSTIRIFFTEVYYFLPASNSFAFSFSVRES